MHRQYLNQKLFFRGNSLEDDIKKISTEHEKYAQCGNTGCRSIFKLDSLTEYSESNFLCGTCRAKVNNHHIVQCSRCQSILKFIPVYEGEEPTIFNVKKCTQCSGNSGDEPGIHPFIHHDIYR